MYETINLPRVDAIAAKRADGEIWLALTNLDPGKSAEFVLSGLGASAKGVVGETLTADRIDAINSFDRPNAVAPKPFAAAVQAGRLRIALPPRSVTVVRVAN